MSKKSIIIYEDWAFTLKELPDEQAIKVMKAMLGYAFFEESLDNADQIAKAIVTPWCKEIDKNMASYKAKVENMNANRQKSLEKKMTETNVKSDRDHKEIISKDKDDDKDKKVKKEKVKKEKSVAELLDESLLSVEVKLKLNVWVAYKLEQHKFSYKPIGFKSFLTEVYNVEQRMGADYVIKAIELSMGKGYKGVIWDLADNGKSTNKVAQQLNDSYRMINEWGTGGDSVVDSWG